jgi:hypothetical protein
LPATLIQGSQSFSHETGENKIKKNENGSYVNDFISVCSTLRMLCKHVNNPNTCCASPEPSAFHPETEAPKTRLF